MKTLLFPTDFSRNSINAINYGLQLMKGESFSLILLHAYDLPVIPTNEQATVPANYIAELVESSRAGLERIRKIAEEENLSPDISISTVSRMGPLTSAVKETLKENKVDLIVMGTHGASGLKKLLIGSNTYDIIRQTDVPVLSIPEDLHFKALKNIMFSTDFSPINNHERLSPLSWIAKKFNANISIVNVLTDSENAGNINKSAESLKIDRFLKEVRHNFYFVESKSADEGIMTSLENNEYEMLTMIIHDLNFFERIFHPSITKRIAMQAKIPLLTVHA